MDEALALCEELAQVGAHLSGALGRALAGTHEIGATDLLILRTLGESGAMRRVDLAAAVGLSASGVSRALQPLHAQGLVESRRDARDARASRVALAAAGRRRLAAASETAAQEARALLAGLDDDEVATLRRMLAQVRR